MGHLSIESSIKEITVSFDELNIESQNLLQAMQYPEGAAPPEIIDQVDNLLKQAAEHAETASGYCQLVPDEINDTDHTILMGEQIFKVGKTVTRYFKKVEQIAVMVATLGPSFDAWLHAFFTKGDPVSGYIVDAIGSEAVESLVNYTFDHLQNNLPVDSWALTNIFSPGYCGWEVQEQKALFSLLPDQFCGIRLTDSFLMQPIKSISGMVGMGPGVKKVDYPCSLCSMTDCYKRRTAAKVM